ncbi:alpha-ketoacid dehydrogenase subunit beta [Kordiimonas aquimaris]|uniref:alpha-ketoacid dehydrogenase subunit beta n=1 Tax=Kordiimonas aquimaris TaxID=707591 RepID=UPI0021CE3215|nr:transketolase C-terminal domain-containing protein [Kordiimonas aquimaris]
MVSCQTTISEAINQALHVEMAADDKVICIGEDIAGGAGVDGSEGIGGVFGVTMGLAQKFGRARVIDTPISETSFVGMAIGASMTGLKPVVEIMFCDFIGVCFDQILNQAAKVRFLSNGRINMPLVIRTTMGAGDGSGAMHSASLHGLLASVPGLTVACPSNAADAAGLLRAGLRSPDPMILLEHKGLYGKSSDAVDEWPVAVIGEGRFVSRGDDITIVAVGAMVRVAEAAAKKLALEGINVEIIDPRTINPLDLKIIISSVEKTGRLIVVDEGPNYIGFADGVISAVTQSCFDVLNAAPRSICPLSTPVPYAAMAEAAWLPSLDQIIEAANTMMSENYGK